jgi:hypothetical protein
MEILMLIAVFTVTLAVAYFGERFLLSLLFRAIHRTQSLPRRCRHSIVQYQ